jgi:methylmalonyl-CoA mutase
MNLLSGAPGMLVLERAVEEAILAEFDAIDRLGGVLAAMEYRYQRSQIQQAAHRYEQQIYDGSRPIVGLNKYRADATEPDVPLVRTSGKKKRLQIARLRDFRRRHAKRAGKALDRLSRVVESDRGNVFAELINTVEDCSLGQIVERLQQLVGRYRPSV